MSSLQDSIVLGFLIRLSSKDAAPLFALINMNMKMRLVSQIMEMDSPPAQAGEIFRQPVPKKEAPATSAVVAADDEADSQEQLPWGVQAAAAIVDATIESVKKPFLVAFAKAKPKLFEVLRPLVYLFEDLQKLENRHLQRLMRGMDFKRLALALYEIPEELSDHILENLSEFNRRVVRDELAWLKDVESGAPEEAQQEILIKLRELTQAGEFSCTEV